MAETLHGAEVLNVDDGVVAITTVSTSVIAIVGTAPFADEVAFPLNTPVLVNSKAKASLLLASAEDTDAAVGSLPSALDDMHKQTIPVVIVVRVEEGETDAETVANVVGGVDGNGRKLGVDAILNAESVTSFRPRILIAPDFTGSASVGGLLAVAGNPGTGYTPGSYDIAATGGGGGVGGIVTVTVAAGGTITTRTIKAPGTGYLTAPTFSLTALGPGTGGTVTATVGSSDNAVTAALKVVADRLKAVIFADGPNTSTQAAIAAAGQGGERVYMCEVAGVKSYRGNAAAPASPSALFAGVQAKVDNDEGFWVSVSNHDILGIVATSRPIDYVIDDAASEANLLSSKFVGTIVRPTGKGYRTWGNRTLSGDFLCVVRTRDIVNASILAAQQDAIDRNITKHFVEHVVGEVNAYLRYLTSLGAILGGTCVPSPGLNTPESVAQGKLFLDFDIGPTYPAEHIQFRSSINNGYITTVFTNA